MRDFGKIETVYWAWAREHGLSDGAKLLGAYVLTSPHSTSIGCYHLPNGYLAEDLQWGPDQFAKCFGELGSKPFRDGSPNPFIVRCPATGWVWIADYLLLYPPGNRNIAKNMAKLIAGIPRRFSYWREFTDVLKPFADVFPNGFIKGLPTPSGTPSKGLLEPFRNTETETETETERENGLSRTVSKPVPASTTEPPSSSHLSIFEGGKDPDTASAFDIPPHLSVRRRVAEHFVRRRAELWPTAGQPIAMEALEAEAEEALTQQGKTEGQVIAAIDRAFRWAHDKERGAPKGFGGIVAKIIAEGGGDAAGDAEAAPSRPVKPSTLVDILPNGETVEGDEAVVWSYRNQRDYVIRQGWFSAEEFDRILAELRAREKPRRSADG